MQPASGKYGVKEWVGCGKENFRPGRPAPHRPEAIVIHILSGTLEEAKGRFYDSRTATSAHYGVGKNGEVHQYVEERDTAFHAGIVVNPSWRLLKKAVNPNFYTIGIEHEGMPEDAWDEMLYDASASLIAEIAGRWEILLDEDSVIMHSQIRASRVCPGGQVRMAELIGRARGKEAIPTTISYVQSRVLGRVNVREKPATTARIVRVAGPDDGLYLQQWTAAGERVKNNPFWYYDPQTPGYVWAGATDRPNPM